MSNESKHTPGPWRVKYGSPVHTLGTFDKNDQCFSMYIFAENRAPGFERSCIIKGLHWKANRTGAKRGQSPKYLGFSEEDEANAKLIAAAPELLELAIEQDEYYKKHYDAGVLSDEAHEKWNRIKVIIKKATE